MKIDSEWESRIEALPQGIFFTLLVAGFVALSLFLALLYHQFELTLFSLILLFLALGLRIWSRFSARDLSVSLTVDKPKVFPEERIDFSLVVENRKLLPVFVQIRLLLPRHLAGEEENLGIKRQCGILWHQKIRFHHELRPAKRGVYNSGAPRLTTGDFFGFFPRPVQSRENIDVLVLPRLIGVKPFPLLNRMLFGKKADRSPVHDPIYILGTRDYRSFSASKNIHWKATARHHKLQEKVFEISEQEKLYLVLEGDGFFESADETAFEKAISAIASLSLLWAGQNYAVGFLTNCAMYQNGPNMLAPERRPNHLPRLFEMLAKVEFKRGAPSPSLREASRPHHNGASCLFFAYDTGLKNRSWATAKPSATHIICRPRSSVTHRDEAETAALRTFFLEDICGEKLE